MHVIQEEENEESTLSPGANLKLSWINNDFLTKSKDSSDDLICVIDTEKLALLHKQDAQFTKDAEKDYFIKKGGLKVERGLLELNQL